MKTIFSYIIQKRFSRVNEDVATDALAYVLETSESARRGIMKLLRGIVPSLPSLLFRTQEMEGTIRRSDPPNMRKKKANHGFMD